MGTAVMVCSGTDLLTNGNFESPARPNGSIPGEWKISNGSIVAGSKGNCVEIIPDMKNGDLMRATLTGRVRKFTPGKKYMLSGICSNAHALWIVAQFDWTNKKIKPASAWIGKKKFHDCDDESEWKSFSTVISVPENAENFILIIEPMVLAKNGSGQKVLIDELKLEALD